MRPGLDVYNSSSRSAGVKNVGSIASAPPLRFYCIDATILHFMYLIELHFLNYNFSHRPTGNQRVTELKVIGSKFVLTFEDSIAVF